jgi:hypothetical protein
MMLRVLCLLLFIFLTYSCNESITVDEVVNDKNQEAQSGELSERGGDTNSFEEVPDSIRITEMAHNILDLIHQGSIHELASYVHQKRGLLFSPYSIIDDKSPVFSSESLKHFDKNEVMFWGIEDGTGNDIALSFDEYYTRFLYFRDLTNSDEVNYNQLINRGNSIHNAQEKFPDAIPIEFHAHGTEEFMEMNWFSIILLFEKHSEAWFLVAVVNNRHTV